MWPILVVIAAGLAGAAFIGALRTARKHWRKLLWLAGAVAALIATLIAIQNFPYWGPALLTLVQALGVVIGIILGIAVLAVIVAIVIAGRTVGAEKREAAEQEKREIAEALAAHQAEQNTQFPGLYAGDASEAATGSIYGGQ